MRCKKLLTIAVAVIIAITSIGGSGTPMYAKRKPALTSTLMTLKKGEARVISFKDNQKKVHWGVSSKKKIVKIEKKGKTSAKIVAIKSGEEKVYAEVGKKKYFCTVKVLSSNVKTIIVETADETAVKSLHDALSAGKPVYLKIKGPLSRADKVEKELSEKVSKYNEYGVYPQFTEVSKTLDNGYRYYIIDKNEADLYKYGLLLVKDIVEHIKSYCTEEIEEEKAYLKEMYEPGSNEIDEIYEKVIGIGYEDYIEAQNLKTKDVKLYDYWPIEQYWSLPEDYYYITVNINGKEIINTESIDFYLKDDESDEDDENGEWIEESQARQDVYSDPNNYYAYVEDYNTGNEYEVDYSDITFHYEPLKVDDAKVTEAINKEIASEIEISNRLNPWRVRIFNNKFCDLSEAVQQYYISKAFISGGTCWAIYDYESYYFRYPEDRPEAFAGDDRSKGRVRVHGGVEGLKAMLEHKWTGVCGNYASMENTLYDLFRVEHFNARCSECNHAWTVAKVRNADNQIGYVKNNYGFDNVAYNKNIDYCLEHHNIPATTKTIPDFFK